MKRIPTSFEIAGHTIKVVQLPNLMKEHNCYGFFNPDQLVIALQKPGRKLKRDVVIQTFWHEVMHAVFYVLGRDKLYADETLVDSCGHMIHQVLRTSKF